MVYVDSDGVIANFKDWVRRKNPNALNSSSGVSRVILKHYTTCFLDEALMPNADFYLHQLKNNTEWKVLTALPNRENLMACNNAFSEEVNNSYGIPLCLNIDTVLEVLRGK